MNATARAALGIAIGLALVGTAAAKSSVAGACSYEDHRMTLVDGAAWVPPPDEDEDEPEDWDGDGEPDPLPEKLELGFVSFPLDAGALERATDRDDEIMDQAFADDGEHAGKLVLSVEDGEITMLAAWFSPGTSISRSGSDIGTLTPAPDHDGKGPITGKYHYLDEDDGFACDLTFTIPRFGDPEDAPPPPGTPLPPGGGEPGKAYLALNAALRAGDLDAMAKLLPPDRLAMMEQARQSPDFDAQLKMMQAMAPTDIVITGGRIDGDTAWVEFTATEFDSPRAGTATLKKEGGRWVMLEESTRDRD